MEPQVLKAGDRLGNGMVVKFRSPEGLVIYGIGVPQAWGDSPLGPTWSYVLEEDTLTLVDTGSAGTARDLEEGLQHIGYSMASVGRVIITHGHIDHDGSCFYVVAKSGAELWAHEVYSNLVGVGRWEKENEYRQQYLGARQGDLRGQVERMKIYEELGSLLKVTRVITDGMNSNGFTFYYTPGHSPDQICILYHRLLFSGDHVLPEITPHPTISTNYQKFMGLLPQGYQGDNRYYGLKAYLKSLKKVSGLGDDITVLPAHRAFSKGRFNLLGLNRALEILEHHRRRCYDLLDLMKRGPLDLETLTRRHFSIDQLEGRNFPAAFAEVVSHMELLEETGDVSAVGEEGHLLEWNGSENFPRFIDEL